MTPRPCSRCGGRTWLDNSDVPAQWACLACGRRTNSEPFEPLPFVAQNPMPRAEPGKLRWE